MAQYVDCARRRGDIRALVGSALKFHGCLHRRVRIADHRAGVFVHRSAAGQRATHRADVGLAMTPLALSVIVLWMVVLALLAVVFALTRQLGVLHERIAPVGALMLNRGLKVGEAAPAVDVMDLDGANMHLGAARADGKSTLLLFVSPTCPVCKSLLPIVKSSGKDERGWLDIVLASDGELEEQRAFAR